ncbi:MAG: ABC transporter substrate-binding protein [Cyanobacteria bacterium P01_C01_bin.89]
MGIVNYQNDQHQNNRRWSVRWRLGAIALLMAGMGAIASCSADSTAPTDSNPPAVEAASTETATEAAETASTGETDNTSDIKVIVTLTSLTADLVHTLDKDKLAGIPGSSLMREDSRFAGLEVVSAGRAEPNLEKIVALKPDLVIGAAGFHDKTLNRLEELGVKTLATDVNGWDGLKALTTDLAQQMGADPQPLLGRYDACLAKAPDSAPSALILVSRQPLLSPNKNSWAGDFLSKFNVKNLTADLQGKSPFDGYITLSEEKVLTSNPEALLVVNTQDNLLAQLKKDAFWGKLKATQTDAVHTFDYFGLINPGSVASIEATCDKLSQLPSSDG